MPKAKAKPQMGKWRQKRNERRHTHYVPKVAPRQPHPWHFFIHFPPSVLRFLSLPKNEFPISTSFRPSGRASRTISIDNSSRLPAVVTSTTALGRPSSLPHKCLWMGCSPPSKATLCRHNAGWELHLATCSHICNPGGKQQQAGPDKHFHRAESN